MPLPYIDTPRTEVDGNATYLTNGLRSTSRAHLSALDSVENSFQTPLKDNDVLKPLESRHRRTSSGFNLSVSRAGTRPKSTRNALEDRHNLPTAAPPKGEFTPMMRSATKNNYLRNMSIATRGTKAPRTPAYPKSGYRSNGNTPGLPPIEMSNIDEESITGSTPADEEATPVPQVASSSALSTPVSALPKRDGGGGILSDGKNVMTLKEQEKVLDKLDKENFGLKIKIHYLQEQLERVGPDYNQTALKENTELKIARATMQRDIARYKKRLQQAERDLEACRLQLQELRDKAKRRQIDDSLQREIEWMRGEIETRETQVEDLRGELKAAKDKELEELEKLRNEIEELKATTREKDRIIEEREEQIDNLKEKDGRESDAVGELEEELGRAKLELKQLQESLEQAEVQTRDARAAQEEAEEDKKQAENNLKELQYEMADKSFYTKGLSRQLEDGASRLEAELDGLRKIHNSLKEEFEVKRRREAHLEEQLQHNQGEYISEQKKLQHDVESARRERDVAQEKGREAANRLKQALDELNRETDEKDLLRDRHNALTDESASLQRELAKSQSSIRELQLTIEDEKQRALDSGHSLRTQHHEEVGRLQEDIEALQQEIEDKEGQFVLERDKWESAKRTIHSQKDRAEEQAAGLKRTIGKLQDVELTLSSRETKLQEVIDSEKDRHRQEEAVLTRQVEELNNDITLKRQLVEEQRNELLTIKEELRIGHREEESLREKVQALEDEVIVLQASLEEEQQYVRGQLKKGAAGMETQLQKVLNEKQTLRDQLTSADSELNRLRASVVETEAQRDELQSQLDNQPDSNHRVDQEKIELRKAKLRLEGELQRLKEEKSSLYEARDSLEKELNSEIERATDEENRLSTEIAHLQDKLLAISGGRDRELVSIKNRSQRLEKRIQELETILNQQGPEDQEVSAAGADLSILRHNLDEAWKREMALLQREADHKTSIRGYKTRIASLEKEIHELQITKFDSHSPHSSPSDKVHEELRTLRGKLSDALKSLNEVKSKNRSLERAAAQKGRKDLHEMLKSSTLEAESLALKLSERDARVTELRAQLRRIREERSLASKTADTAMRELEVLRNRYDQVVEDAALRSERKSKHEKEIRGLGKEIIWLRARLKREEAFRRDLAWCKGLMELGERVRAACNEADLHIVTQMGVEPWEETKLYDPRRKLRTTILMVMATVRMQRLSKAWSKTRKLGDGLGRAKAEVLKRREDLRERVGVV